jgi:hypothetical protein
LLVPASFTFTSVADLPPGFWRWPHVDPAREWACHGDGSLIVVPDFLDRFELLRRRCDFALPINSGYRSPAYNQHVGHSGDGGPHTTGLAIDIRVSGPHAHFLLKLAMQMEFRGIGLQQKGPVGGRYIHLDDVPGDDAEPRPTVWTY